ncbi:tetratricopeptide repeat protein [Synechococcus sp. HB1133]|uniref:tetratricopeptide repeat protein n=1 Tax=unclassified Synechococcus TaxID=2626047 RepID=UPI001CF92E53
MAGFGGAADGKASKSSKKPQLNFQKWFNQAIYFHKTGRLREAESIYKKMIAAGTSDPAVFCNLGILCKNSGRIEEALENYEQALDFEPDDPQIYSNIGNLYRGIGKLDQALQFTLKSLDLDHDSSTIQMNLGCIYRDLGKTDEALIATVKAIEFDEGNIEALQNLKSLASDIKINALNRHYATKAYEILINRDDFSHRKLCPLFVQDHLEDIQTAAKSAPIISDQNQAFHRLASDWRFRKSLALLIPPHQEIEEFLTRLRKEFLVHIKTNSSIPPQLKPLLEALATQCFLNEYVYWQSESEQQWINDLISYTKNNTEVVNEYLPMIGCYIPIHVITNQGEISRYPINSEESKAFIDTQFKEVQKEEAIKARLSYSEEINDEVSRVVQQMYEENPYPRYQYADHTPPHFAKQTIEFISLETTISNPLFTNELSSPNSNPKILIAGCGTGNQIINASRYKNAQITAIDISNNSLAYATRKSQAYQMNNIRLQQLDILDANQLQDVYDVIECSGVLHHMQDPAKGLAALNSKLKPGGYIKIGLYSKLSRQKVSAARELISKLSIQSTPKGIRDFRKQVFDDDQHELKDLSILANDFYSLSECRDLCFHVQEHQFTTETLEKLLEAEKLVFCGFMLPEEIKRAYQSRFPEDRNGTSLSNWGDFEKDNPSTFQSMYQFWAYKPL